MENVKEEIINDALELCMVAINTKDVGSKRYIAMHNDWHPDIETKAVLYNYKHLETPYFLEQEGVLKIQTSSPSQKHYVVPIPRAGACIITINYEVAEAWVKETISKRLATGNNQKIVTFPEGRDFIYENGELHLKLNDGSVCTLDLSKADTLRPIFESFFYTFKESKKKLLDKSEVLAKYRQLTKQSIDWQLLINRKSSIVGKMINTKPCLKNRIIWKFDKPSGKYQFEILPLSEGYIR